MNKIPPYTEITIKGLRIYKTATVLETIVEQVWYNEFKGHISQDDRQEGTSEDGGLRKQNIKAI